MTGRSVLIAAAIVLAVTLWQSGIANRSTRRRVIGIGPNERILIALLGGAAILGAAYLFDIPLTGV